MSVWTKVNSKALYEDVNMEYLGIALSNLELSLDNSIKEVNNRYGKAKVDAALSYQGKLTSLGIVVNQLKGISIVGDTWRSGIVKDKQADKLIDLIAQQYQSVKVTKSLELQGWDVIETKKDNKIILECVNYN